MMLHDVLEEPTPDEELVSWREDAGVEMLHAVHDLMEDGGDVVF